MLLSELDRFKCILICLCRSRVLYLGKNNNINFGYNTLIDIIKKIISKLLNPSDLMLKSFSSISIVMWES